MLERSWSQKGLTQMSEFSTMSWVTVVCETFSNLNFGNAKSDEFQIETVNIFVINLDNTMNFFHTSKKK